MAADYFSNLGTSLIGGAANTIFGMAGAKYNAGLNYHYNELGAINADKRTRALYEDYLSPAARIRQLKEAGLSPSLFADGAGGGAMGMTQGAQGSGASGVGLPTGLISPESLAQVELMKAETRKTNAEADDIEGLNESGAARIAGLWAEADARKAAAWLNSAEATWQELQTEIGEQTKEYSIWTAKSKAKEAAENASKAYYQAEREGLAWNKDLATFESEVKIYAQRVEELAADIALKHSQTKLNDVQRTAIKDYVIQGYIDALSKAENATQYGNYVEAYAANLPKQLELRSKELDLEKWRVGLEPITELIKTAGYMAGASQLGDGGYTGTETTTMYDKNGKPTGSQQKSISRKKLPKFR